MRRPERTEVLASGRKRRVIDAELGLHRHGHSGRRVLSGMGGDGGREVHAVYEAYGIVRGVVVPRRGGTAMEMQYRPKSVYLGAS